MKSRQVVEAVAARRTDATYSYDALGRLVATSSSGTVNNGLTTGIAYDPAGNRSCYTVAGAATGTGGSCTPPPPPPPSPPPSPPPPSPPPPPPPGNQPPVANADTAPSIPKCGTTTVNVTANDTDPEGNYPLTVTGVSGGVGLTLTILSASTIEIDSLGPSGLKTFNYTVSDSLGATSTGTVSVTVTTVNQCS
ncbi:MAG TPA: Ig-like domain-containing protein [Allosphingosinicella sp.]|jgi:YD repeat-containing protein